MNSHNSPIALTHTLSTGLPPPLSVKKFAKTAHLHEIRRVKSKASASAKKGLGIPGHERQDSSASENIAVEKDYASASDQAHWIHKSTAAITDEGERDQDRLGAREPLSILPLQNRARSPRHPHDILSSAWHNPERKVIDLDAESENGWVDTDIEGSEVGDRTST